MADGASVDTKDLPQGLEYGSQGLVARGILARDVHHHLILPRPNRPFPTCIFDELADNTMLGMHLAEMDPGSIKCDHRHLDETMVYILEGHGVCQYRQDDNAPVQEVDWGPGDLLVIPTNAYHRHVTHGPGRARQLTFRNVKVMNSLLHGSRSMYDKVNGVYDQDGARFRNRYDDEPDYFERREVVRPGVVRTNLIRSLPNEALPAADPAHGTGVALQSYEMAAQRILDVALIGLAPGGHVRPHRPWSEEALLVLAGRGHSELWSDDGRHISVSWAMGDLLCPPLGTWRRHEAAPDTEVRLLRVRNLAVHRALGIEVPPVDTTSIRIDRFPTLVAPDHTTPEPT
jgi:quercetin dioxygenase-like cupin family protein